ncbi:MAG: hypothetical protein HQM08_02930 [Candidatus Riflebacteria bacterium]|nr:hypothetical protein [Candidatus Riflebacteria bacterium]
MLIIFFGILVLEAMLSLPDESNIQKRLQEKILQEDLNNLRSGIKTALASYPDKLSDQDSSNLITNLATVALCRYPRASANFNSLDFPFNWRTVINCVKNPSLETDVGFDYKNQGDYTAGNGIPDGWLVTQSAISQYVSLFPIPPATYVLSYWFKGTSTNEFIAKVTKKFDPTPLAEIHSTSTEWCRFSQYFTLIGATDLEMSFSTTGTGLLDNVMIEKWAEINGIPATGIFPSAWTESTGVAASCAMQSLQHWSQFGSYLLAASPGNIVPATVTTSYWYQW